MALKNVTSMFSLRSRGNTQNVYAVCHDDNCDFADTDTINKQQLEDIALNLSNEEKQHIAKCHKQLHLRLNKYYPDQYKSINQSTDSENILEINDTTKLLQSESNDHQNSRQNSRRRTDENSNFKPCNKNDCEYDDADTIALQQLNVESISDGDREHIAKYHRKLHVRLQNIDKMTNNSSNSISNSTKSWMNAVKSSMQNVATTITSNIKEFGKNKNSPTDDKQKLNTECNCQCWTVLQTYCKYFKSEPSKLPQDIDITWQLNKEVELSDSKEDLWHEQRAKVIQGLKKGGLYASSKENTINLSEAMDLWDHYLDCHVDENNYVQCDNVLCDFKRFQLDDAKRYYRKQSWNLSQTMHVYFYHRKVYIGAGNNVKRGYRYISDNKAYQIRKGKDPKQLSQSLTEEVSEGKMDLDIGGHGIDTQHYDQKEELNIIIRATKLQITTDTDLKPIQYESTTSSISLHVLEFGAPFEVKEMNAKYQNFKEEIFNNEYRQISPKEWNKLLKACIEYIEKKDAKKIGLEYKEIVALKLYTDFDSIQRQYRKCYREKIKDRTARQEQFYHWNCILLTACLKSTDIITDTLYHGVNQPFKTPTYSGTYYGPISTTTKYEIARRFAGKQGRIFELYPSFGRSGLKLSWLSNFHHEAEVLYFNTSFQIVNLYKSDFKMDSIYLYNKLYDDTNQALFEKSILKALHVINTDTNVISFNDMRDLLPEQDLAFHRLAEHEQISILYLLYLQYTKDWHRFWKNKNKYQRIAFAKYRDQFIVLAKNIKAVKMERLPMLIQHFFYEDHKKYRFPFLSPDIDLGIQFVQRQFVKNQALRFETITRLFPNAQQLLINGNNFDWSLKNLINFMKEYDLNGTSLQEIEIRFEPQYPTMDEKYESDHDEATKRLKAGKAGKNIGKLRKYGWIFETKCRLRRIGFEPVPELPFLLVFVNGDEMYYKTYSRKILSKAPLPGSLRRGRSDSISSPNQSVDEGGHPRNSRNSHRFIGELSPLVPSLLASLHTVNNSELFDIPYMDLKSKGTGSFSKDCNVFNEEKENMPSQSTILLNKMSGSATLGSHTASITFSKNEGQNPMVLGYNPKNCILSQDIVNKLGYKKDLNQMLLWRLQGPKISNPNDPKKKKFIRYCCMVEVLVLDPLPMDLRKLFIVIPDIKKNNKPIISFENIYNLFPNIKDIFLRWTRLNLLIAKSIINFINKYPNNKFQRIFFCKLPTNSIRKNEIAQLQEIFKSSSINFKQREQMVSINQH